MVQSKPINPIPTTVRIPHEIKSEIDLVAKRSDHTIHRIIVEILRQWYNIQIKAKK